jgi:hypothetical protein
MNERRNWDLPQLGEPYDRALAGGLDYLLETTRPTAVVVTGSIVRGNPDPSSDLDIFVLHDAPWRQRLQRRFAGVPVELFVNHPSFMAEYFASESARGRPSAAHMLATGHLAYDTDDQMAGFIAEARDLLDAGPEVDEGLLTFQRYGAAMEFEDAVDVLERDPDLATLLLHRAVDSALRFRFWEARRWQPRNKELLSELETFDPQLAKMARRYYQAASPEERLAAARQVFERMIGVTGSFDWDSPRDYIESSST